MTHTEPLKSTFAADEEMREIVCAFVAGLPRHVTRLTGLLRDGNLDELRRALHQLKGAGGGYGFPAITELAGRAEQAIVNKSAPGAVLAGVEALVALLRTVEGYDSSRE